MTAQPTDTRPTQSGGCCTHCGATADLVDLVDIYQHVGGHGLIWQGPYCLDYRTCWARWETKHEATYRAYQRRATPPPAREDGEHV